jgi:DNA primase
MEQDGLSFLETVERLATRYGIAIPEEEVSPQRRRQEERVKRLRQINMWAAEIYQETLTSRTGAQGLTYLTNRGITKETMKRFGLGYAPDQWEYLTPKLLGKGVREQELILLGLATKTDRGSLIDKFRGRVIFPIIDERENVTGFGGRVIGQGNPKYLNTQETPLFHKGRGLYGISVAKSAIRERNQVIIMEGYMDTLVAHQHGVTNTVASLGTSLTVDQAKLLTSYTYRTLICFDGDSAGAAATIRGLDILDQQGCQVGVIRIPQGNDPDDYIRERGQEAFTQLVAKASSLFEYKFLLNIEKYDAVDWSGKVAIIQATMPELMRVKSPAARLGYITMMSDTLQFPEPAIRAELRQYSEGYRGGDKTRAERIPSGANGGSETLAQSIVIRRLLADQSKYDEIEKTGGASLFSHPPARGLYQTIKALLGAGYVSFTGEDLVGLVDRDDERDWLTGVLIEEPPFGDPEKNYIDSLQTLNRLKVERQIKRVMAELIVAEKSGDASSAKEMMIAIAGLNIEKQRLKR